MAKNLLIALLTVLLCITSYIIYDKKQIVINTNDILDGRGNVSSVEPSPVDSGRNEMSDAEILTTAETVVMSEPDIVGTTQTLDSGFEPEIYLDPTIGLTISDDQQIVSNYRVIGPRKFSLLTDSELPMVEINLDTGRIKLNPEYDLDEASIQSWRPIDTKYQEATFASTSGIFPCSRLHLFLDRI